ncbi:MAG: protein kinase, partial [Planctomycetes bacterium]|nr:protein kinase [Planctomycetota bacterium]
MSHTQFTSLNTDRLPKGVVFVRTLGRTPFSEVLLVEKDGVPCALKLLHGVAAFDERILERWRREARLLGAIEHDNLVRSYGTLDVDGHPGLLLEFIDGPTLRQLLTDAPLGWEQAVRYGVQVARALERLHRSGAIHRDVKPHNILIHPTRGAVLADLGLVRTDDDATLTRQGVALGSPAYMSPEQARDPSEVGPEADVYSLAATLYHALSGRPPFLGRGVGEVIHRVLHEEPEPLSEDVPLPIRRVLACALAKDPESRYARARDFALDLGRVLLGDKPILLHRRRRRRRSQFIVAGVVSICGLCFALWSFVFAPKPNDALGTSNAAAPILEKSASVEQRFHEWLVAASIEEQFRAALAGYHFLQARQVLMTFQALPIPATEPKFADRRARWLASARLSFDLAQEHFYQKYLLQMSESLNSVLAHPQLIDPLVWKAQVITAWDKSGINLDAWRSSDGQFPLQDALQEKVQIIVRLREAKEKASMLARAAALEALLATQEDEGAQAAPESAATQQPQQPDEIEAPATMPSSPPLQLEPATPSSETQARNARQSLLRQVQADAPEATAEWLSDSIRLIYETSSTESDWSKGWRVKSPQALDGWQLTSWRLEWANP